MAEIFNFLAFKKQKESESGADENIKKEKPNFGEKIDIMKMTNLSSLVNKFMSRMSDLERARAYQDQYHLANNLSNAEIIGWINNFESMNKSEAPFYAALIDLVRDRELDSQHFRDK